MSIIKDTYLDYQFENNREHSSNHAKVNNVTVEHVQLVSFVPYENIDNWKQSRSLYHKSDNFKIAVSSSGGAISAITRRDTSSDFELKRQNSRTLTYVKNKVEDTRAI